jgi:hypothetical protein
VHGGGYFAPHGTNNIFCLRTQYSSTYGRPITYLMGGSLVLEVHSSSYFCWEQVGDWTTCTSVCICGGCLGGPVGCWS